MSLVLTLYRGVSSALGAFAGAWLLERAREGKEDPSRVGERFAHYSHARPEGGLIWMHAASVGESGVALALIDALAARAPALSFLLSTGTRTSAELVARRAPPRTSHIYAPLDRTDVVRRFLTHWRPDVGVFLESELWPNLILEAKHRGVALALVNARMSPRTLARWRNWSAAGSRLMRAFDWVSAADARTAEALTALRGTPTPALGNLKLAAPAPRVQEAARDLLAAEIGARPLWLAASTHEGEDEIVLDAHARLRSAHADALLILVPRHPERGAAIAALAGGAPRRARDQRIGTAPVYVADTLGELGVFYDLAPVALVAGSLLPPLKGHNPVEPAKAGSAILSGSHVESFDDLFADLFAAGAARKVLDAAEIADAVAALWRDEEARARQTAQARGIVERGAEAFETTLAQILALMPASARTQRPADASA